MVSEEVLQMVLILSLLSNEHSWVEGTAEHMGLVTPSDYRRGENLKKSRRSGSKFCLRQVVWCMFLRGLELGSWSGVRGIKSILI